jgi:outer membrane lipoprotein carrier protein
MHGSGWVPSSAGPAVKLAAAILGGLIAWTSLGVTAGADSVAARPIVSRVLARFEQSSAFEAQFRQVNRWAAFDLPDTAWGRLTLAPPARFRLAYDVPTGHLVGSDGRYVWTFVPEERQVLRAPVGVTTGWGEFFFRGLESPADSLAETTNVPPWGAVARVALTPHPDWSLVSLYMEIALTPGLPVGYGYVDAECNESRFRFTDSGFLDRVDEGLFRFTVPAGYELFEAR